MKAIGPKSKSTQGQKFEILIKTEALSKKELTRFSLGEIFKWTNHLGLFLGLLCDDQQ